MLKNNIRRKASPSSSSRSSTGFASASKESLIKTVLDSRTHPELAKESARAMTELVHREVFFNNADLSGVRIPGADLRGGQFDRVNFRGADLRNVIFYNAHLRRADFSGALLNGVKFGIEPSLFFDKGVTSFAVNPKRPEEYGVALGNELWICNAQTGVRRELRGHRDTVNSVSFSPDGQRVLSGSRDKTLRLWELESGESRELRGHSDDVNSVSFSPDGKRVLSGSRDKTIRVWELESGESRELRGHSDWVQSVSFSPDGRRMLSGSHDKTLRVWELESGASRELRGHSKTVTSVSFSPDGKRAVSGSEDQTLRVWDLERGSSIELRGHSANLYSVSFSPDGQRVLSGGFDKMIRVWDVESGTSIELQGHHGCVTSVRFSPDGQRVLSGSYDKTLRVWDLKSGESFEHRGHSESVTSLSFSPDGQRVLSGSRDKTLRVWDLKSGDCTELRGHSGYIWCVGFSPDGKCVVSGGSDKTIRVWEVESGESKALQGHADDVMSVSFSPDGKWVLSGSYDATLRVWEVDSGESIELPGHCDYVESVRFSPDGRRLLSGSHDSTLRVWDLTNGGSIELLGHSGPVNSVRFSPDGLRALSGSADKTLRVWDLQSGKSDSFGARGDGVQAAEFFKAGAWALAVSGLKEGRVKGVLEVFDLSSRSVIGTLELFQEPGTISVHENQVTLGDASGNVSIYELEELADQSVEFTLVRQSHRQIHLNRMSIDGAKGLGQKNARLLKQYQVTGEPAEILEEQLAASTPAPMASSSTPDSFDEAARKKMAPSINTRGDMSINISIPSSEIKKSRRIGQGGFGAVYEGEWNYNPVAIKELLAQNLTAKEEEEFKQEASIMVKQRSKYIVQCFGVCLEKQAYAIVMELLPRGSLFELLHNGQPIPWKLRYSIAMDVVKGLAQLHKEKIIHRDLKSLNVLLDTNLRAKLCDFGLAKIKGASSCRSASTQSTGTVAGSTRWMAPELFKRRAKHTPASDMYSYGMLLWELASRELPFADATNDVVVMGWIKDGEKEDIPEDTPAPFASLIQTLWGPPNDRCLPDSALVQIEKMHSECP